MVAFISATPNPVIFTYPDVIFHHQLDVSIGWDTGDPAVKGRVFRSLNSGPEVRLAGAALSNGTTTDKIALDQVLTVVLRRATNSQELARTTVTTQKNALAAYMTDPDLGFIFSLNVKPGVDTIAIAFQTKQPAVPYVELRRHDSGELADGWMGGDFRQQHQREFNGFGRGLPQDTAFDVLIVAMKDIGGGRVRMGSGAHNPEVRGAVTTGARTVSFLFDLIHVRNDGDPGMKGAGEFTFTFGVGDAVTQQRLGPMESWGEGDIPAGYDREVAKTITVDHAPRRMWAQVNAWEDDTFILNPDTQGFGMPGIAPSYDPPGSYGWESDYGSFASVTGHFDTDETASGRQRGFIMSTGDFSIAYDVFGSMTVTRRNGVNNFRGLTVGRVKTHPKLIQQVLTRSAVLPAGRTLTVAMSRGFAAVSLKPDGAVIVRTDNPRTGEGCLTDLGGRFDTSVTLVASSHDTLHVIGLTSSGEVVARTVRPGYATEGGWIDLGGAFTGDVTCVARDGLVDVLACDAEGRVFHRTLPTGERDGDWKHIGSGVGHPVAATGTPAGDLAVFGLDPHGRILHKRLTAGGKWRPRSDEWDALCPIDDRTAAKGAIGLHWATERDLIVSVFVGDDLAGALLWCNYPEPDRDPEWVSAAAGQEDIGKLGESY